MATEDIAPEDVSLVEQEVVTVPAKGTTSTLDIGTWNLEWFGDTGHGPTDEALQLSNVRDVIAGTDLDIWGLEEVVSVAQFDSLKSQLPGYDGFVASSPIVAGGSSWYSSSEQKVGILYKTSVATVSSAKVILTSSNNDFAGRPPMEVSMTVNVNGASTDLIVIVLHAKAFDDMRSYNKRKNASAALKSYLDTTYPTQKVIVVGDFNDDVDTSIASGKDSPYKNFVDDPGAYFFPTKALSDAGDHSTASYPDVIDHHLLTDEVQALYQAGSVEAYKVDQYVPSYSATTTDHYPVLARYVLDGGGSPIPTVQVSSPNGGESLIGGTTFPITWTWSAVTDVHLEVTLNGSSWTTIAPSVPASDGSFSWLVPDSSTSLARIRVSDVLDASITDTSDGAFTIVSAGSAPLVFLNEILANEPGGATSGEFIELVNAGGASADLGGWTLSDEVGTRHTFTSGTTLPAGAALVIFASDASSGALGLNNSGDTVTLRDAGGMVIDAFNYPSSLSSTDGVSMNRNPDGNPSGSFVLHTTLSSSDSSPGTRVDGTPFGS